MCCLIVAFSGSHYTPQSINVFAAVHLQRLNFCVEKYGRTLHALTFPTKGDFSCHLEHSCHRSNIPELGPRPIFIFGLNLFGIVIAGLLQAAVYQTAGRWPETSWVHYTTNCNTQSSASEDGQNNCPKHVELTGIINKPLLLHLVGCLYYLYQ